jgi:hypothetical protein
VARSGNPKRRERGHRLLLRVVEIFAATFAASSSGNPDDPRAERRPHRSEWKGPRHAATWDETLGPSKNAARRRRTVRSRSSDRRRLIDLDNRWVQRLRRAPAPITLERAQDRVNPGNRTIRRRAHHGNTLTWRLARRRLPELRSCSTRAELGFGERARDALITVRSRSRGPQRSTPLGRSHCRPSRAA